ncbi:hypothetical protein SLE2022_304160 [Rubroshorea leprosula]
MAFQYEQSVEICKKQQGFFGSYYTATLLAAVGRNRYLIRYETRFSEDKTRLLVEPVDADEVRPFPPPVPYTNFFVSDRVDAYIDDAWWVGSVTTKVDPNYIVRLDSTGDEVHCAFYRLRLHLEFQDGQWLYIKDGPQTDSHQGNAGEQGGQPPNDGYQTNADWQQS